jgi:putative DNA primase/helicase
VEQSPDMLVAALAWHDSGFAVIPVRADGSKAPMGSWKQ